MRKLPTILSYVAMFAHRCQHCRAQIPVNALAFHTKRGLYKAVSWCETCEKTRQDRLSAAAWRGVMGAQ